MIAQRRLAAAARAGAFATKGFIASLAVDDAIGASIHIAIGAAVTAVVANHLIATRAGDATPIVDRDVGRITVVVLQDATHQDEQITDPAVRQGLANRRGGVALAQDGVLDMGMGYRVVRCGWIGIQRDNPSCNCQVDRSIG